MYVGRGIHPVQIYRIVCFICPKKGQTKSRMKKKKMRENHVGRHTHPISASERATTMTYREWWLCTDCEMCVL